MLDRIKASITSLAPAEQRVARLVLGDPYTFANLPVSQVITATGSPLAAAGNIHLARRPPGRLRPLQPMVSRLLHLVIIDVLATTVALRFGGHRLQPLPREMKNNLRTKRYA